MELIVLLLTFSLSLAASTTSITERCARGFMDFELIKRKAAQLSNLSRPLELNNNDDSARWLFPGLRFNCTAKLLGITIGIKIKAVDSIYPRFELWKEQLSNPNHYEFKQSTSIVLDPANFTTNGIYHYMFVQPLIVEERYVVGFYQPNGSNSTVSLYYDSSHNAPTAYKFDYITDQTVQLHEYYNYNTTKWNNMYPLIHPITGICLCWY